MSFLLRLRVETIGYCMDMDRKLDNWYG
jgi:hypothetical protein